MTEAQLKKLKEINNSVPKAWWNMLTRKVWANPTIRELVDRGLADPDVSKETKDKLQAVKLSSAYSEEIEVINEDIEKKIDEFLTRKVRQAIKNGSLPPPKKEDFDVKSHMGSSVRKLPAEDSATKDISC
jgi:hypothetical protein